MTDPVNHPRHYTSHPSGIECIQVTRHMSFNLGNAIKYIWRFSAGDRPVEDLQKAVWYLRDEIERLRGTEAVEQRMHEHVEQRMQQHPALRNTTRADNA